MALDIIDNHMNDVDVTEALYVVLHTFYHSIVNNSGDSVAIGIDMTVALDTIDHCIINDVDSITNSIDWHC